MACLLNDHPNAFEKGKGSVGAFFIFCCYEVQSRYIEPTVKCSGGLLKVKFKNMKWVKTSERLPPAEGRYFVKTNRPFLPDNNETKQIGTFAHNEWYLENHHHSRDFFYFKPYEWLDEDENEATCCHCGDVIEHPLCRSCDVALTLPTEEY